MFSAPKRPEIDKGTIKLLIGVIALSLANVTSFFSSVPIASISASYYEDGWARNFLIGFLFAISALMLAYNGESRKEMLSSKFAAFAAFGVAMFPCGCDSHTEIIPYVHYISAAVMFSILTFFCFIFYQRAMSKGYTEASIRSVIYAICGIVIVAAMGIMAINFFTDESLTEQFIDLPFIAKGHDWLRSGYLG